MECGVLDWWIDGLMEFWIDEMLELQAASLRLSYRALLRVRSAVQILSLLFLFAVPLLNVFGVHAILGTLYSLSVGEIEITDPLMALQTILLTKQIYLPLLLGVILPVLLALIFGRVFCSWMCPQNTLSEWLDALQKRFWKSRWRKSHHRSINKNPRPAWYWGIFTTLVLATLAFSFPLLSYLSMPGIISSAVSQSILGPGVGVELALVLLILVSELLVGRRYWCKYVCPVGALLSVFRCRYTMHLVYEASQCACHLQTEPCHYVCPLQLSPKRVNVYPYCFNCGLCTAVCEKTGKSALTLSALRVEEHAGSFK